MRAFFAIAAFAIAAALLANVGSSGQDKKKEEKAVTLKGKICCNKCELSVGDECATVIVVSPGLKSVTSLRQNVPLTPGARPIAGIVNSEPFGAGMACT